MVTEKKPHDKLMAYKTLVIINLGIAVAMFALRWWITAAVRQVLNGETTGEDGPAEFAVVCLGSFIVGPVTLILLIAAAIITICQSMKLVERKTLSPQSLWLMLAATGVVIEVVAVFL